jgi:hypothetical protein
MNDRPNDMSEQMMDMMRNIPEPLMDWASREVSRLPASGGARAERELNEQGQLPFI